MSVIDITLFMCCTDVSYRRVPLIAEDLFINSITLHTATMTLAQIIYYLLLSVPLFSRAYLLKCVDLSGTYIAYILR